MSRDEYKLEVSLLYSVDEKVADVMDDILKVFKSLLRCECEVSVISYNGVVEVKLENYVSPESVFDMLRRMIEYVEEAVAIKFPNKITITYEYTYEN